MRGFHEDYMASTPHLQAAMSKLDSLSIGRIAPQHGSIIDKNVSRHIEFIKQMKCGLTLMESGSVPGKKEAPKTQKGSYRDLIAMVLEREKGVLGMEKAIATAKEVKGLEVDDLGNLLSVRGDGKEVLGLLLSRYSEQFGTWAVLNCRLMLISAAKEYGLELPGSK
ncbi:MAG: hypothetical protein HYR80_08805 [Nitrospirae bacterium]|nr:hypothetical protein [Nitrospirota bacterium]